MNKDQWQEQNIEKQLQEMPNVKDTRSKEEVFLQLKKMGLFEEQQIEETQQNNDMAPVHKQKKWMYKHWVMTAAAVAAIMLPLSIYQLTTNNTQLEMLSSRSDNAQDNKVMLDRAGNEESVEMDTQLTNEVVPELDLANVELIEVEEKLTEHLVVPRTLVISHEKMMQDYQTLEVDQRELFNAYLGNDSRFRLIDAETEKSTEHYYAYIDYQQQRYFVAVNYVAYKTVEDAIAAMQQELLSPYYSPIPAGIVYEVTTSNGVVDVHFTESFDLETIAYEDALTMIEALQLTAQQYHYDLKLSNTVQKSWLQYNFDEVLPKTLGINRLEIR